MCGRSTLHDAPVNILERFDLPPVLPGFRPRYNIAPSQEQWTLFTDSSGKPGIRPRRWGLVPYWATDPGVGHRMINARAESLSERPAFRDAFRSRRCLVLADGYYEWRKAANRRIPFYFRRRDQTAFPFAGLWETWKSGAVQLETCTIVTVDSRGINREVHDRMPLLLGEAEAAAWVSPRCSEREACELLVPGEGAELEMYEVTPLVNNPANDSAQCILPADSPGAWRPRAGEPPEANLTLDLGLDVD